jgi:hypothetical protein
MKTKYQNQHFVSQVLLRRFASRGHLQVFDVETGQWRQNVSPKKTFAHGGYTQLLANGQIDNSLETEFGKVETKLPITLAALDAAAQKSKTELPTDIYENFCWYCAFLWRLSPFAKAKAPADFVFQMNLDLEQGKTNLLKDVVGLSESDIAAIKIEHAQGKKVIIDSKDFIQLIYRIQFTLRCKEDFVWFRHFVKWKLWNSTIDFPISDMAVVQSYWEAHKTNVYILPISPRLLLIGTISAGTHNSSDETFIQGGSLDLGATEYLLETICLSAITSLASQHVMPDIQAIRARAIKSGINYTKIVNTESLITAGTTDFNGAFGVRLVSRDEFKKFINLFIKKGAVPHNGIN